MKRIKTFTLAFTIGFMVTGGIASIVTGATTSGQNERKQTAGDFIRGAQVWANNCTRCHNLRDPKEFNDKEWQVVVTHMRVRAGLTGQDTRDVLAFMQQSN